MHHRSSKDNLGFLSQQTVVTFRCILEALAVGMFLTADSDVLQYLAVEHLYLLVALHQIVKVVVWNGEELGVLQRLDDKSAGFLLEEALDAEDDATLEGEVLGDVLLILIIILPHHSLFDEVKGAANLSFLQYGIAFGELHGNKDAA